MPPSLPKQPFQPAWNALSLLPLSILDEQILLFQHANQSTFPLRSFLTHPAFKSTHILNRTCNMRLVSHFAGRFLRAGVVSAVSGWSCVHQQNLNWKIMFSMYLTLLLTAYNRTAASVPQDQVPQHLIVGAPG